MIGRSQTLVVLLVVLVVLVIVLYVFFRPQLEAQLAAPTAVATAAPAGAKQTPVEEVFHGCPGEGDGTDPDLNRLKNRVDVADWQPTSVQALLDLRWPPGIENRHMGQWSSADRARVEPSNGLPVVSEGYLLQARQEGPESPNCHSAEDFDFHMWLAAGPNDERATKSVVVEVTPRVRAKHPTWTLQRFNQIARERTRVRIAGWTMLDPEHPEEVGKSRGTIWEIHPVMKVELQQGGGWREL